MLKTIRNTILLALIGASLVYAQQQNFPCVGEITSAGVNVRCDSTISSKAICALSEHEIINIVAEAYDWYKIRLPKTAPCYINAKFVNVIAPDGGTTQNDGSFGTVKADSVNLRLEPEESSYILGRINKDRVVNIIEKQENWYKIIPPEAACGWINKKFVNVLVSPQENTAPAARETINASATGEKPNQTNDGQITIVGMIEPYAKVFGRKGTHKITTDNKQTYILSGNKKMLSSCSYRKAAIKGKFQDMPGQPYPVILVEKIEVLN